MNDLKAVKVAVLATLSDVLAALLDILACWPHQKVMGTPGGLRDP